MNKSSIKKCMTGVVKVMANAFCYCWLFGRCRFPGRKNDFDYFVYDLRTQYPTRELGNIALENSKFFEKQVVLEDEFERTISIKVGDICIRYSFDKTIKKPNHFISEPKWEVAEGLYKLLKQSHHNASVVYLKDERKKRHGRKTGLN